MTFTKIIQRLLICSLPLLSACATSPMGRHQLTLLSNDEVNSMGAQSFEQLKKDRPISQNVALNQFITCTANILINEVGGQWEVVVFEDSSLNAFALPGNKIGVHTGLALLVDNADQLAAIIGHEIGHVQAQHGNERMSQSSAVKTGMSIIQAISAPESTLGKTAMGLLGTGAQYGIILPFSRLHESEADIIGLNIMAQAGFNPKESVNLWLKMAEASNGETPPEFLSTHPAHDTRIQELTNNMPHAIDLQKQAIAKGKQPKCSLPR